RSGDVEVVAMKLAPSHAAVFTPIDLVADRRATAATTTGARLTGTAAARPLAGVEPCRHAHRARIEVLDDHRQHLRIALLDVETDPADVSCRQTSQLPPSAAAV